MKYCNKCGKTHLDESRVVCFWCRDEEWKREDPKAHKIYWDMIDEDYEELKRVGGL